MGHLHRTLVLSAAIAVASPAISSPISLHYEGTVTAITKGFPGLLPGTPIDITIAYDPANLPPIDDGTSTSTDHYLNVDNGSFFGVPWATWMNVTATFGAFVFNNDLTDGAINSGGFGVTDGHLTPPSFFEDNYTAFYVSQFGASSQYQRNIIWQILAFGDSNPNLINSLNLRPTVDFSKGSQSGELDITNPGPNGSSDTSILFF